MESESMVQENCVLGVKRKQVVFLWEWGPQLKAPEKIKGQCLRDQLERKDTWWEVIVG